jgi:very-short-patch-repair endonuclease
VTLHGHEVDMSYAEQRLVVEVDGLAFHATVQAAERDRRRDAALLAAGYRVLRVTWRQIPEEPERLLVQIARSLADHR